MVKDIVDEFEIAVNEGRFCKHCGKDIDGNATGSPRNCIECESDREDWRKER